MWVRRAAKMLLLESLFQNLPDLPEEEIELLVGLTGFTH